MPTPAYVEPVTGKLYSLTTPRWCSDAGRPLLITPQQGISATDIDSGVRSVWRYHAAFPLPIADPISLGEGLTPLIQHAWAGHRPWFKLEWFNPTGSFKDRGTTLMMSYLRQLGITDVVEDSSGNGGASVAGYGAAGGMNVRILAPAYTSPGKIAQAKAYGADVQLVEGTREDTETEAIRQAAEVFYASHNWQALFLEGTKTLAYELWEDNGFNVPDNVIVPVGAGSSLLGLYFGFTELIAAGQVSKLPRLFAAQPLNCSPIDASFRAGSDQPGDQPVDRPVHQTIAEGTAIKRPRRLAQIIGALRESRGDTVAVTEQEIMSALRMSCRAGFFIEPTSATAPAALNRLIAAGTIKPSEMTVVVLTGTGLKASSTIDSLLADKN